MSTVAMPARAASAILCSPSMLRNGASHSGALCVPTTLSRITFNGQGAARDIAVSTTIASRMITIQPWYGLRSSRISRILPEAGIFVTAAGAAVSGIDVAVSGVFTYAPFALVLFVCAFETGGQRHSIMASKAFIASFEHVAL